MNLVNDQMHKININSERALKKLNDYTIETSISHSNP